MDILEQKEIKQIHRVQETIFYHISPFNCYLDGSLDALARVLPHELPVTHLDFIRPGHMVDCTALTNGMAHIAGALLPYIPQKALLIEPNLLARLQKTQMYPRCFNGDVSFGLHYALELMLQQGPYVFDPNLTSLPFKSDEYLKAVFINPKDLHQKRTLLPIL